MSFLTATKHCTTHADCLLSRWPRYNTRNPGASPYDIKTAKHFIEGVVRGCSAGKKEPSIYTMLQKWTDFGAGWKRRAGNSKIPPQMSESIYFVRISTLSPKPQDLMVLLVYTNRATEEVQPFNDSTNSALHDGEPLRYRDQAYVEKRLASISIWKDPRTGPRCLYAFYLFVGASGRVS